MIKKIKEEDAFIRVEVHQNLTLMMTYRTTYEREEIVKYLEDNPSPDTFSYEQEIFLSAEQATALIRAVAAAVEVILQNRILAGASLMNRLGLKRGEGASS